MNRHRLIPASVFCLLAAAAAAPASALNDPIVVQLRAAAGSHGSASATLFGSGSSVLVNVTGDGIPSDAAVTLNDGDCAHPGGVAFSLSRYDGGSMTRLSHTLAEVAGKAKSLVIHQTSSETSAPLACGKLDE